MLGHQSGPPDNVRDDPCRLVQQVKEVSLLNRTSKLTADPCPLVGQVNQVLRRDI